MVAPGTNADAYRKAVLASNPLAYWPLDDPVGALGAEELIAAKTGIVQGGVKFGAADPWGNAAAANMAGGNAFIVEPSSRARSGALTVECWFSTTTPSCALVEDNANQWTPLSSSYGPTLFLVAGVLTGYGYFPGGVGAQTIADTAPTADGQWHHVALTYDGISFTLYRDGNLVRQVQPGGSIQTLTGWWHMGASYRAAAFLSGNMAHVSIYTRALASTEVASHFNAQGSAPPKPPGTILDGLPIRQAGLLLNGAVVMLDDLDGGWLCTELDLGYPDVRDVTDPNPNAHGIIDRTQFFGGRTITAKISGAPGGTMDLDRIADQFAPYLDPSARPELHFTTIGNAVERIFTLRASAWSAPMDPPSRRDLQATWIAADPIARSAAQQLATAWTGVPGTGRTYPLSFNRVYPAGSGAPINAVLTSNGEVPFRPTLRIYGPITGPTVSFYTQSGQAFFVVFLASARIDAGNFVLVDTANHTAYLNGLSSQPWLGQLDWTQMAWPVLPVAPDSTTMSISGQSTTGISQVQATWRDRYLL